MKDSMQIPSRITPCPILEALIEFRFDAEVPEEAVFGMFYPQVKNTYGKVEKLPILQIPEGIREHEPDLRYKAHYKMSQNDLILQLGPRVISLSHVQSYRGWEYFSQEIIKLIQYVCNSKIMSTISRIGLRYINFFEGNIFGNTTLSFTTPSHDLGQYKSVIRTEIPGKGISTNLNISNNMTLTISNNARKGSVIDLDTFCETPQAINQDNIFDLAIRCHNEEKEIFFSLLKADFLQSFNPEY